MTVVLAIDPGEKTCGACVGNAEGARFRYRTHLMFAATLEGFLGAVSNAESIVGRPSVVALEKPDGHIYAPFRGPPMLATSGVATAIQWLCEHLGIRVVAMNAAEVRRLIVGKSRAGSPGKPAPKGEMDRLIKRALPAFIDDMPPVTNEHTRDAMAIGVAAAWILASRKRST